MVPIVIMGKPAQAGFDAADHQRHITQLLANQIAVADQGPVRSLAALATRGIAVI